MGDHRAGPTGSTATTFAAPHSPSASPAESNEVSGRRAARDVVEPRTSLPYAGRRVAQVAPMPAEALRGAEALPYAGRRVAGRNPVVTARTTADAGLLAGRRIALDPELTGLGEPDDVVGHLLRPTTAPALESYVGRRVARPAGLIIEPTVAEPTAEPTAEPVVRQVPGPDCGAEPMTLPTRAPLLVAPSPEAPVVGDLVVQDLAVEDLAVEMPIRKKPDVDELVGQLLDQLAREELVVDEPVVEQPVVEVPVVEELITEGTVAQETVAQQTVPEPADVLVDAVDLIEPVLAAHPELTTDAPSEPVGRTAARTAGRGEPPTPPRASGRRAATRRPRIPSLPLLAGVAVLAISAGGALQAVHPGLAGAQADGRISPASALSGTSAVGSASLLGGRGTSVSRDSDRQALSANGDSLQAAADAQAKERDAALSVLAGKAEKQAAEIKLHQWVLPVTPGVYHLTARFGDYSSLWSHFHTGLDFAAPTGTPIMAVAGGTITEVGYSGAYGNRTIETLADGTELWYCHQNTFGTSVGATVKPGQVIGYVGSTGNVTGPHLHLEVHPGGGDPVDPFTALQVHGLQP